MNITLASPVVAPTLADLSVRPAAVFAGNDDLTGGLPVVIVDVPASWIYAERFVADLDDLGFRLVEDDGSLTLEQCVSGHLAIARRSASLVLTGDAGSVSIDLSQNDGIDLTSAAGCFIAVAPIGELGDDVVAGAYEAAFRGEGWLAEIALSGVGY
ncbi:hypothetical protein GS504_01180 [Rhodococcus hoagii]|nr:hypothetical protein [Prescottella equi]NKS71714.1 hypothetical protein [Prescottella equi]